MSEYNFFDNPPNLRSQKKTGMAEIFHPVNFQNQTGNKRYNNNNSNNNNINISNTTNHGNYYNRNPRNIISQDFEKYPLFDKNISNKISLVIGRKSVGKTDLVKELVNNLIEIMSGSNIITDYSRITLLTSHQCDEYTEIEETIEPEKTNYEVLNHFTQLTDKIKDHDEEFSNSLVIIEDDINLDEKNKDMSDLKEFFDYARHKQMTIIIVRNNIGSLPTLVSSVVDYLFVFCGAIYSDLQKLHSRFLPEIGFGNFYRIYREMMNNTNAICVVNLVIPPRSNKKENKKDNKRKWNLMDSFYRYYLDSESSEENDEDVELEVRETESHNRIRFQRKRSVGIKRSWRKSSEDDDNTGQGYTHFQPIDDKILDDNLNGRLSRIGNGNHNKNISPSSKKKEEIKDQVRIKLNQINELIDDIKNLIRI